MPKAATLTKKTESRAPTAAHAIVRPGMDERRALTIGPATGTLYGELDGELLECLPRAIRDDSVLADLGAQPLRRGPERSVWRWNELVIKLYGRGDVRDLLRPSQARRAAETHARLLPIRSPRPRCALAIRSLGLLAGSALVYEFVEGPDLSAIWRRNEAADRCLPELMAAMHERRIFHGDFHARHLIWNQGAWVVIDLDSLRHPLRKLRLRTLAVNEWARLVIELGASDALRGAFEAYLVARRSSWDTHAAWAAVVRRTEDIETSMAHRRAANEQRAQPYVRP